MARRCLFRDVEDCGGDGFAGAEGREDVGVDCAAEFFEGETGDEAV